MSLKGLLTGSCRGVHPSGSDGLGWLVGPSCSALRPPDTAWLGGRLARHLGSDRVGPSALCLSLPPGLAFLLDLRAALSPFRGSGDRFLASFLSPGFLKRRCETDSQVFGVGVGRVLEGTHRAYAAFCKRIQQGGGEVRAPRQSPELTTQAAS